MESYHQRHLRKILHVSWDEKRTNISILDDANIHSITTTITKHRLRWTGHVIWVPDTRLPKQILYSQLSIGHRAPGGQKNITRTTLGQTSNCTTQIHLEKRPEREGATFPEDQLRQAAKLKQQQRKEGFTTKQAPPIPPPCTPHPCPHCSRACGSRIGLISHLRTHKKDTPG